MDRPVGQGDDKDWFELRNWFVLRSMSLGKPSTSRHQAREQSLHPLGFRKYGLQSGRRHRIEPFTAATAFARRRTGEGLDQLLFLKTAEGGVDRANRDGFPAEVFRMGANGHPICIVAELEHRVHNHVFKFTQLLVHGPAKSATYIYYNVV